MLGTIFAIGERFAWTLYNNSILVYRLTTVPATLYKTITPTRGGTIPANTTDQYGGAGAVVIQEFVSSERKTYWSLYASDDPDTCLGTIEYSTQSARGIGSDGNGIISAQGKIGYTLPGAANTYLMLDFENGTYTRISSFPGFLITASDDFVYFFDGGNPTSAFKIFDRNGNLYGTTRINLYIGGSMPRSASKAIVDSNIIILCNSRSQDPIACFYISDILANVGNIAETALDPFNTFDRPAGYDSSAPYAGNYVEINGAIFGIQKMETGYSLFYGDESNPTENSMVVSATDITTITTSYILLSNGSLYLNNTVNTIQPANNAIHGNSKLGVVTQAYSAGDTGTATIIFS
jgi:hypothetical protein